MSRSDWTSGYSGQVEDLRPEQITPSPGRMLVLQNIEEVKKIGLLWVPSTSKMSRKVDTLGKVLAITWPEHYGDQWIHVGDWVIFGNYSGAEFKFETDENRDNLYRILKPEDIYAVVKSNGRADGPRE